MLAGEHKPLINYETLGRDVALSIPTPDHYLLLFYAFAAQQKGESVRFPVAGVDGGSIPMLAVQIRKVAIIPDGGKAAFRKTNGAPGRCIRPLLNADYREGSDLRIPAITARRTSCARELASSFVFAASIWACIVFDDGLRIMPICGSLRPPQPNSGIQFPAGSAAADRPAWEEARDLHERRPRTCPAEGNAHSRQGRANDQFPGERNLPHRIRSGSG